MVADSPVILLLLIVFTIFLLHYVFFLQKIFRGLGKLKQNQNETIPYEFISVIIPFRNESENILANLKSVESQIYPKEKFEVVYVNDSSDDNSLELLQNNITVNNVRVISGTGRIF